MVEVGLLAAAPVASSAVTATRLCRSALGPVMAAMRKREDVAQGCHAATAGPRAEPWPHLGCPRRRRQTALRLCVAGFALDGMHCYKEWQSYLQDSTAEAKFTETGALWMLGYDRAQNDAMVERLNKFNVKGDVLDADAMKEKFPLLSTEPFPTYDDEGNEVTPDTGPFSAVYEHGCGHLDSSTCLTDLHKACVLSLTFYATADLLDYLPLT